MKFGNHYLILAAILFLACSFDSNAQFEMNFVGSHYTNWDASAGVAIENEVVYLANMQSGLTVIDVSDPMVAVPVGGTGLVENARDVGLADEFAIVADAAGVVRSYNVSTPSDPMPTGMVTLPSPALTLQVHGSIIYVGFGSPNSSGGIAVLQLTGQGTLSLVGQTYLPDAVHDLTLLYPALFAATGSNGLVILDVSDQEQPVIVSSQQTFVDARSVDVYGNYAYVADAVGALGIVNISSLYSPYQAGSVVVYSGLNAVRVAQQGAGAFAFVVDSQVFRVYNLATPSMPTEIAALPIDSDPTHPREIDIVDDMAYIANGDNGLVMIDISYTDNPVEAGSYNGMSKIRYVYETGNRVMVCDQLDGTRVLNVETPSEPYEIYGLPHNLNAMATHNEFSFATAGEAGVYSFDVSNADAPVELDHLESSDYCHDIAWSPSGILVANGAEGLWIIEPDAANLAPISTTSLPDSAVVTSVESWQDYAILGTEEDGIYILQIFADGDDPVISAHMTDVERPRDFLINDPWLFVAYGEESIGYSEGGVAVYELNDNPLNLEFVSDTDLNAMAVGLHLWDNYMLLTTLRNDGIAVVNVDDPYQPFTDQVVDTPGEAWSITEVNNSLYVADGEYVSIYEMLATDATEQRNPVTLPNLTLLPAYPNPFNSRLSVTLELGSAGPLRLSVIDVLGREVAVLTDKNFSTGQYLFSFNAESMASGVYFLQAQHGMKETATQRITLIR